MTTGDWIWVGVLIAAIVCVVFLVLSSKSEDE